jgi:hypothetical protein
LGSDGEGQLNAGKHSASVIARTQHWNGKLPQMKQPGGGRDKDLLVLSRHIIKFIAALEKSRVSHSEEQVVMDVASHKLHSVGIGLDPLKVSKTARVCTADFQAPDKAPGQVGGGL